MRAWEMFNVILAAAGVVIIVGIGGSPDATADYRPAIAQIPSFSSIEPTGLADGPWPQRQIVTKMNAISTFDFDPSPRAHSYRRSRQIVAHRRSRFASMGTVALRLRQPGALEEHRELLA